MDSRLATIMIRTSPYPMQPIRPSMPMIVQLKAVAVLLSFSSSSPPSADLQLGQASA